MVGVQDQHTEVPRAFVTLHPGFATGQKTAEDIQGFVGQRVSDHKQLRSGVVFGKTVLRLLPGKI